MSGRLPRRALSIIPLAFLTCYSAAREGPVRLRGRVLVEGNAAIPTERLGLSAVPRHGEPFPDSVIAQDKRSIMEAYAHEGYLQARVTARESKDPQTGLTDVTYEIVEGDVIFIEQAAVDGVADPVRRAQAQRLITLGAGDRFDSRKVRESRKKIQRLPWVKTVEVNVEGAKAPNKVYVDFDIDAATASQR